MVRSPARATSLVTPGAAIGSYEIVFRKIASNRCTYNATLAGVGRLQFGQRRQHRPSDQRQLPSERERSGGDGDRLCC
jgi:hypothetical protein